MNATEVQAEINNWLIVAGIVLSALVHGYQLVVKGGGVRGIMNRFLNGTPPDKTEK